MNDHILSATDITKTFGTVEVVKGVSVALRPLRNCLRPLNFIFLVFFGRRIGSFARLSAGLR